MIAKWRRWRHMTIEEKLIHILETRGTKAFIVLPAQEVPFRVRRRG